MLEIIFEIESRKKQNIKTLFVIDDIADSFDYKNKYAIVEYLKEISDHSGFFTIILTHNFDFFRTVQDRILNNKWKNSYIAIKMDDDIHLEQLNYNYISNPLKNWKSDLQNDAKFIASITFARNIAEYIGDKGNLRKLTSILHMKTETRKLTIGELLDIYKTVFKDLDEITLEDKERKVFNLIFDVANKLSKSETEVGLNLENKVVLSLAIRLKSEIYMIYKIRDDDFVAKINSNQTGQLLKRFKIDFGDDEISNKILEKVSLMTPENIHLNSFMYEPILDISDSHLKTLYEEVTLLLDAGYLAESEVASGEA